jgi:ABC-type nitrate/sulfonate/bicarbonate transport system, ATPase component
MATPLVQVRNLSKSFCDHKVLNNVSLTLEKHEFVSLLGPSGCGKTVLLKILSGLMNKTGGEITYNFPSNDHILVSMAFQKSPFFPWLNLIDNVTICMNQKRMSKRDKKDIAIEFFKKASLEKFIMYYPDEISGGMRQKVNIIRCFCSGGELILMDEPFVFLDFIQRTELQQFTLKIWQKQKKTLFFVTHNLNEAIILSDRILLMSADKVKL